MPTMEPGVVVVGASLAGAKAVETLRTEGYDGPVTLVGAETERPYERPPLSKGYLLGEADRDTIYVHPADWYLEHDVDLRLGVTATALDVTARTVTLEDGTELAYGDLLLTTGSRPRRLPLAGADLEGVLSLRSVGDSDALRAAFVAGARIVVVGGGWIGLETAAAARHHGAEVTVVEPQPTPLYAVLGPELGALFAELHREHGVDLRLDTGVSEIRGAGGRATGVVTSAGDVLPADAVVVGVGILPNVELAADAGLPVDNGILVDDLLRTAA